MNKMLWLWLGLGLFILGCQVKSDANPQAGLDDLPANHSDQMVSQEKDVTESSVKKPAGKVCPQERSPVCTREYRPVCGKTRDGLTREFSNGCSACANENVVSWEPGTCLNSK